MVAQTEATRRSWGVEQRLEFIEFRVFWEGGINRGDIVGRFGVSTPQASNDLAQYRAVAPRNLAYNASAKRYVASPDFEPAYFQPSSDQYLTQLKAVAEGVINLGDTFIGAAPAVAAMPVPSRIVDPSIFRDLLAAVRAGASVELRYQSMNSNRPDPQWRRITPHAFGSDGLRWHVRGYCHIDHRFKDFVLSRVRGVRAPDSPGPGGPQDNDWHFLFSVELVPNPALSEAQRASVAWEYAMPEGRVTLPVRIAFLYYLRQRLRLDFDGDRPAETPVVVANRVQFDAALASATGQIGPGDKF